MVRTGALCRRRYPVQRGRLQTNDSLFQKLVSGGVQQRPVPVGQKVRKNIHSPSVVGTGMKNGQASLSSPGVQSEVTDDWNWAMCLGKEVCQAGLCDQRPGLGMREFLAAIEPTAGTLFFMSTKASRPYAISYSLSLMLAGRGAMTRNSSSSHRVRKTHRQQQGRFQSS
jgi:hypothetical protein